MPADLTCGGSCRYAASGECGLQTVCNAGSGAVIRTGSICLRKSPINLGKILHKSLLNGILVARQVVVIRTERLAIVVISPRIKAQIGISVCRLPTFQQTCPEKTKFSGSQVQRYSLRLVFLPHIHGRGGRAERADHYITNNISA